MKVKIAGFPGYVINEQGQIFTDAEKEVQLFDNRRGYLVVSLKGPDGKRVRRRVHRLVAEAFIPNPKGLPVVNHKDGNKHNNRLDNLEWVSYRENTSHWQDKQKRETRPVAKISAKTSKITGVYFSIRQASKALGLDYRSLFEAVKQGFAYKGNFYRYCTLNVTVQN